jgi:hypothetical protein
MAEDKMKSGRGGAGDSGGGAYPNPHKVSEGKIDGYMGHGGQTDMPYHGDGQLGVEKVGDNPNAPTEETGASDD